MPAGALEQNEAGSVSIFVINTVHVDMLETELDILCGVTMFP